MDTDTLIQIKENLYEYKTAYRKRMEGSTKRETYLKPHVKQMLDICDLIMDGFNEILDGFLVESIKKNRIKTLKNSKSAAQ